MINPTRWCATALAVLIGAGAGCQTLTSDETLATVTMLVDTVQKNYPTRYSNERAYVLMTLFQCASRESLAKKYGTQYDFSLEQCAEVGRPLPTAAAGSDSGDESARSLGADAIELDIAILKRRHPTGEEVVEVADNDVLYDGGGGEDGDRFRIFVKPSVDTYLYVVAIDSTGWVQPLLPSQFPDALNPVQADHTYVLPGEANWYGLDEYKGVEHVVFVASPEPRPDLVELLSQMTEGEQPAPAAGEVVDFSVVFEEEVLERGLTGIQPGVVTVVQPPGQEPYEVQPTNYAATVSGTALVVTRFFQHK